MGVEKTILKPGISDRKPKHGELIHAHYVGTFPNSDEEFDNSRSRNKPLTFIIGIGSVIKGWDEGIMDMCLGEVAILKVTSDSAYGVDGLPPMVPPNSDLVFEVELLQIGDEKADSGSQCVLM
jgi:FK506-binding protein 1